MTDVFAYWFLIAGGLLLVMAFAGAFVERLPITPAVLYLAVGFSLGPTGLKMIGLDAVRDAPLLERLTEIAVLLSLFSAGLKLRVPFSDGRWRAPVQLATVGMVVTVALVAAAGVWGLGLSLGAAVLLGAVLAPTDPVLASDVQVTDPQDRDRLRVALTGEAGLNDGTAFPFVMLGLGLLGVHHLGSGGWRWWAVDLAWATVAGLAVGAALGAVVGRVAVRLRHRRGADEFLALGLIAL
jgi:NhaP-type Na+/H+ or K+/H+ antiporter